MPRRRSGGGPCLRRRRAPWRRWRRGSGSGGRRGPPRLARAAAGPRTTRGGLLRGSRRAAPAAAQVPVGGGSAPCRWAGRGSARCRGGACHGNSAGGWPRGTARRARVRPRRQRPAPSRRPGALRSMNGSGCALRRARDAGGGRRRGLLASQVARDAGDPREGSPSGSRWRRERHEHRLLGHVVGARRITQESSGEATRHPLHVLDPACDQFVRRAVLRGAGSIVRGSGVRVHGLSTRGYPLGHVRTHAARLESRPGPPGGSDRKGAEATPPRTVEPSCPSPASATAPSSSTASSTWRRTSTCDRAEAALAGTAERLRLAGERTGFLELPERPLSVEMGARELLFEDGTRLAGTAHVRLFAHGVASVRYEVPLPAGADATLLSAWVGRPPTARSSSVRPAARAGSCAPGSERAPLSRTRARCSRRTPSCSCGRSRTVRPSPT